MRLEGFCLFYHVVFSFVACGGKQSESVSDSSVNDDTANNALERSFHMGMTSWPYAATIEAVENTKDLVEQHGDLYAIWLDNGLPWEASLQGGPYPQTVTNKLVELNADFPENHQRFVSVGLLDLNRKNLATDWDGAPRTGNFESIDFDDPNVFLAYSNWLDLVIQELSPDYFNFAVEISEIALNSPDDWNDVAHLTCALYGDLKTDHPELPIFFSVALKHPESADGETLMSDLSVVSNCTDYAAASTYGYVFYGHPDAGEPNNLPDNWLAQINTIIPDKPVVVAETAWPAEDLIINEWGVAIQSSPDFQERYVAAMLEEANALNAVFVIWWCPVDFDELWQSTLNSDPLASIWRDTGLYDSNLDPRPALQVWDNWLDLSLADGDN